jgi:hypothetical protein
MTLRTSTPEHGLIADLPPTRAGLWTAVTMTDDIARHMVAACHGDAGTRIASVADACAQAAQAVSVSAPVALHPTADLPEARISDPAEGLSLLGDLVTGCIDLAVDLLGNEDEPLDPAEVLAVTRAVSVLCVARSLVQAGDE